MSLCSLDCNQPCTAKMNMFPDITFELNYEWSSEEEEGKESSLDTSVQTSNLHLDKFTL